ncbi:MAG: hypothetical protein RIT27_583 [Pseudomonadota bacterium]|jgi:serine phosphatase RsbU (regulator of sigma subunit)
MYEEFSSNRSATTLTSLDRSLQAAEADLQQEERNAAQIDESLASNSSHIEKIREILFGHYTRDYDKRLGRLTERYSQESQHLRDDMLQRLKALEDMFTREADSLAEKAKVDRQERVTAHQDLSQELTILKNELNVRFTQIDEQLIKEVKQLRQQFHSKTQELALQIRQMNDTLVAMIKQEVAQINEEKVNRGDLASFFTEFAFRLSRDLSRPADK